MRADCHTEPVSQGLARSPPCGLGGLPLCGLGLCSQGETSLSSQVGWGSLGHALPWNHMPSLTCFTPEGLPGTPSAPGQARFVPEGTTFPSGFLVPGRETARWLFDFTSSLLCPTRRAPALHPGCWWREHHPITQSDLRAAPANNTLYRYPPLLNYLQHESETIFLAFFFSSCKEELDN